MNIQSIKPYCLNLISVDKEKSPPKNQQRIKNTNSSTTKPSIKSSLFKGYYFLPAVSFKGGQMDYLSQPLMSDEEYEKTRKDFLATVNNDEAIHDYEKVFIKNYLNKENIRAACELYKNPDISNNDIHSFLLYLNKDNADFFRELYQNKSIPPASIPAVLKNEDKEEYELRKKYYYQLKSSDKIPKENLLYVLSNVKKNNTKFFETVLNNPNCTNNDFITLTSVTEKNQDFVIDLYKDGLIDCLCYASQFLLLEEKNLETKKDLYKFLKEQDINRDEINSLIFTDDTNIDFIKDLIKKDKRYATVLASAVNFNRRNPQELTIKADIYKMFEKDNDVSFDSKANLIYTTNSFNIESRKDFYKFLKENSNFSEDSIASILSFVYPYVNELQKNIFLYLRKYPDIDEKDIVDFFKATTQEDIAAKQQILEKQKHVIEYLTQEKGFDIHTVIFLVKNINDEKKLGQILNFNEQELDDLKKIVSNLYVSDYKKDVLYQKTKIENVLDYFDVRNIKNIDNFSRIEKRELLKRIIKSNSALFEKDIKSTGFFQLLPDSAKEYNMFITNVMSSIGINTMSVSEQEQKIFEETIKYISNAGVSTKNEITDIDTGELYETILKLFPEIKNSNSNTVSSKEMLDKIFKTINTLKMLPEYEELSENDKKLCILSLILKNIEISNIDDSAYYSYHMLKRFNLSEKDKEKVYKLIKNQNWLDTLKSCQQLSGLLKSKARLMAIEFCDTNLFELEKIITKAGIIADSQTNELQEQELKNVAMLSDIVSAFVEEMQDTALILPQTRLPKASELVVDNNVVKDITTYDDKGQPIKNRVVFLKPDLMLDKYGFEKGLNSNDLNLLVHAFSYEEQFSALPVLADIDSDAVLSTSYVNYMKQNYHVFRNQGFILYSTASNILCGANHDFGSGYQKNVGDVRYEYLFDAPRKEIRHYVSNALKANLNCDNKVYRQIVNSFSDESIGKIEKDNPKIAEAIRKFIENADIKHRSFNRNYNEYLITKPQIQGVFYQGKNTAKKAVKLKDIPVFLRKYAQDNDLPVIYFGE